MNVIIKIKSTNITAIKILTKYLNFAFTAIKKFFIFVEVNILEINLLIWFYHEFHNHYNPSLSICANRDVCQLSVEERGTNLAVNLGKLIKFIASDVMTIF